MVLWLVVRLNQTNKELLNLRQDYLEKTEEVTTYINKLGQTVNAIKPVEYDNQFAKELQDIDKSFANAVARMKAIERSYKDLSAIVQFAITSEKDSLIAPLNSQYDNLLLSSILAALSEKDIPVDTTSKMYAYNDGTLDLQAVTFPENLWLKYQVNPGNMYIDLYRNKGKLNSNITFDNPNIKLLSSNVYIKSAPKPLLSFTVGAGGSMFLDNSVVRVKPSLNATLGVPIFTIYRK